MHNLFFVYFFKLYMFRPYLYPSSGGTTVCIQQLVLTVVYIRLYLLMMGVDTAETCRGWRNTLRISCASSWSFFTRLYRDARSTKHKPQLHLFYLKYPINNKLLIPACRLPSWAEKWGLFSSGYRYTTKRVVPDGMLIEDCPALPEIEGPFPLRLRLPTYHPCSAERQENPAS
jgi:hypothetical protein